MTLTDAQKQQVAAWIEQGLKLSEIQNKLSTEMGVRMTYMEVRFLMDDLKLKPKDPEPAKQDSSVLATTASGTMPPAPGGEPENAFDEPLPGEPDAAPAGASHVQVSVDQITRPGAVVSGKVTFSDGESADWYLDQTGRLGLAAKTAGYRPTQADVLMFQSQLRTALASAGF